MHNRGAFIASKDISLESEGVLLGNTIVDPETAMQEMPSVHATLSGKVWKTFVVLIFAEDAVADVLADRAAILRRRHCLRLRASACHQHDALRFRSLLVDDVDHTVDGVRAP